MCALKDALFVALVCVVACRQERSEQRQSRAQSAKTAVSADTGGYTESSALGALPEMATVTQDGFVDLELRLVEEATGPNGAQRLRALGRHHGSAVGVGLEIAPSWSPHNVGSDAPHVVYRGSVQVLRDGPGGDALLRALDELYATRLNPAGQNEQTVFEATTRSETAPDPLQPRLELELSADAAPRDARMELYLTIDRLDQRLQLREKDQEYRAVIVRALGRF